MAGSTQAGTRDPAVPAPARAAGPLLVWFAVLGGFLAWGVHLFLAWMVTEVVCVQGHDEVAGLPVRWAAGLLTALPGLVALAALVVGLRAGWVLRRGPDDRRTTRARFLVRIGCWLSGLSILMIVFGAIAVVTLPTCGNTGVASSAAAVVHRLGAGGGRTGAVIPALVPAHGASAAGREGAASEFVLGAGPAGTGAVVPAQVPAHGASAAGWEGAASVFVLAGLAGWVVAHLLGTARCAGSRPHLLTGIRRTGPWRLVAFLTGVAALAVALGPWSEEAVDRSLAAHMGQHMLLIVVAAPLLAAGAPGTPLVLLLPVRGRQRVARFRQQLRHAPVTRDLLRPVTGWLLSITTLWVWHLPPMYEAALSSPWLHALEHACFLLGAWTFWWHVLHEGPQRVRGGAAVLYVFAATLPAAALGAVLTFATAPLYPSQAQGAVAAGLDPVRDQQLAGLVMWVPPDVLYLLLTVALFLPWLTRMAEDDERRATPPPIERAPTALVPGEGR